MTQLSTKAPATKLESPTIHKAWIALSGIMVVLFIAAVYAVLCL